MACSADNGSAASRWKNIRMGGHSKVS